jgi:signal transduction histidine kinase
MPTRANETSSVTIIVEDTGPGIPSAFMEKLFKPFNSTKASTEGTGLGLYLSREIITQHNGRLGAENKPGGGARFTILLPCYKESNVAAA